LFFFAAKPAFDGVKSFSEHALVSFSDIFFGEIVFTSSRYNRIFFLLKRSDALSTLEMLNELLTTDGSIFIFVHQREKLFDRLQVFLHNALLQLPDRLAELF
jgi:hypothetical protein